MLMILYRICLQISLASPAGLAQLVATVPAAEFPQPEQSNLLRLRL